MAKRKTRSKAKTTHNNSGLANQQFARFREAYTSHEKYVAEAMSFDNFYRGEQWKEDDRKKLEDEGRPALTINQILPTINIALGEQVARRAEIRYKPKRQNASAGVATILTKLADHILEQNDFSKSLEPQIYADGLIQDRGFLDVRMNFDSNMYGEVEITAEDPIAVIPDPEAKRYDPSTWNEVWVTRWKTVEDIEATYGKEKAEAVMSYVSANRDADVESVDMKDNTFGGHNNLHVRYSDLDNGKRTVRNVRVIERQYYKTTRREYFVDLVTGESRPVPDDWGDTEKDAFIDESKNERGEPLYRIVPQVEKRVRWTVTAGNVVLHDDWSIYKTFTIIPYFPFFRRGKPFGLVRNLIGPQEFLNKTRSQELHIVNTTANSGWIVQEGSLANMTTDELQSRGAETGVILSVNPGFDMPQKIKPNPVPTGVDRISEKGMMDIRTISGMNDAMAGFERADVSGVALDQKAARGQVQLQVPFSSLELTRQFLGRKILELVQDFYTEERVFFITNYSEPGTPQEEVIINQQQQMQDSGLVANDITLGEYEVTVASAPARDTFDEMQFSEALSLRQAGIPIPSYTVVQYSHLAQKEELAAHLKQMEGYAPPSEAEQQMAQMQQQLMMADMQLELERKNSEIAEIQSRTMLNSAKAQDLVQGDMRKRIVEHQMNMARDKQNLDARMQMSQLSQEASLEKSREANRTRLTSDAMRQAAENQREQFHALQQIITQKNSLGAGKPQVLNSPTTPNDKQE